MKKGLLTYILICFASLAGGALLLIGASRLTIALTDWTNAHYMPLYQKGESGFSSPWYTEGYHIVDEGFLTEIDKMRESEKDVVSIGSSCSVISYNKSEEKLSDGYDMRFFVCGNGCWKSDYILENVIDAENLWQPEDVVKLEVSFSTFRNPVVTITGTILDKWGKYKVNDDGTITKNVLMPAPLAKLNLEMIRLQNAWELFQDYRKVLRGGERPIAVGNYKNNYFDFDAVAANCAIDENMENALEEQMLSLKESHPLVVELSPLPAGLAATEYGQKLVKYQDERLIPFLEKNEITYLDYRYDFEDDEYADGVHLGYDASIRYTHKLCEDLDRIISRNSKK